MQYIIQTRKAGRKVYGKVDEGKYKASGLLVHMGFTRDKHVAHHYATLREAQSVLKEYKVAYEHLSFSIEEHVPYTTNEGLRTEPTRSLTIAFIRAQKLFPEIDFETLKWSDGFYTGLSIFDINALVKSWKGDTTFTIRARLGEVHIYLNDNDQASYWAAFL